MTSLSAPFFETRRFDVLRPGSVEVLTDESGDAFWVELYAPQSQRMQDYDRQVTDRALLRQARTNGKYQMTSEEMTAAGAARLAHAIKDWNPLDPSGQPVEGLDTEKARAAVLNDPGVRWWLTEQLVGFFDKANFIPKAGPETTTAG